jgi:hypothetical protein
MSNITEDWRSKITPSSVRLADQAEELLRSLPNSNKRLELSGLIEDVKKGAFSISSDDFIGPILDVYKF